MDRELENKTIVKISKVIESCRTIDHCRACNQWLRRIPVEKLSTEAYMYIINRLTLVITYMNEHANHPATKRKI